MKYEINDKVLLKYKGEYQVGVITGASRTKDSVVGYFVRAENGSAYSIVPVDKKEERDMIFLL